MFFYCLSLPAFIAFLKVCLCRIHCFFYVCLCQLSLFFYSPSIPDFIVFLHSVYVNFHYFYSLFMPTFISSYNLSMPTFILHCVYANFHCVQDCLSALCLSAMTGTAPGTSLDWAEHNCHVAVSIIHSLLYVPFSRVSLQFTTNACSVNNVTIVMHRFSFESRVFFHRGKHIIDL